MVRLFTNATATWLIPLVIALLSVVWSASTAYSHNDKELSNRITALEAHHADDTSRLDRIETKLDAILYDLTGVRASKK